MNWRKIGMIPFKLSELKHTWIIDIDGTIFKHCGHLLGEDEILPGVKELWNQISSDDYILLITARDEKYRKQTLKSLSEHDLRYDNIIFGVNSGERILINDKKPWNNMNTAIAWNVDRDKGFI